MAGGHALFVAGFLRVWDQFEQLETLIYVGFAFIDLPSDVFDRVPLADEVVIAFGALQVRHVLALIVFDDLQLQRLFVTERLHSRRHKNQFRGNGGPETALSENQNVAPWLPRIGTYQKGLLYSMLADRFSQLLHFLAVKKLSRVGIRWSDVGNRNHLHSEFRRGDGSRGVFFDFYGHLLQLLF